MGRLDKDRHQKELAVRFCLACSKMPFLEVVIPSASDLSDASESLTDIDVLGLDTTGGGGVQRTIFDCKSANKMSAINRAFWAKGVMTYANCDEAFVILKNRPVHNHRISALALNVDLHNETSFVDLGRTFDPAYPRDSCYQASIDRWDKLQDCYDKNKWSQNLKELISNSTPLSDKPWSVFRRLLAELRHQHGYFDPKKADHTAIFFDVLSSAFVLWVVMARDIRRIYEPTIEKALFEKILRYYFWGGKESYDIRVQLRSRSGVDESEPIGLPEWDKLIGFAGTVISAPQDVLDCAFACKELAIRASAGAEAAHDERLTNLIADKSRVRQYSIGLAEYLTSAGKLPGDIGKTVEKAFFDL